MILKSFSAKCLVACGLLAVGGVFASAQKPAPIAKPASGQRSVVKQIDIFALKNLVKPSRKPRLINFWATWCDPCREEFPDLVKIDDEYRGKIDFITVSLDDLAEIDRDVPKFLAEMKAFMPAYLLKTDDENAAISAVSQEWKGGLPFTILFDENGGVSYFRQGKISVETVRSRINGLVSPPLASPAVDPSVKQN
jgi:thiol-disulfide isomerase/thioredoxin